MTDQNMREQVRQRYAAAANAVKTGEGAACCGSGETANSCFGSAAEAFQELDDSFGASLYDRTETDALPKEAVLASLGCGNPLAVADLHEGERVLDLGSGGGIDVLLSARRGRTDRQGVRPGHDD